MAFRSLSLVFRALKLPLLCIILQQRPTLLLLLLCMYTNEQVFCKCSDASTHTSGLIFPLL